MTLKEFNEKNHHRLDWGITTGTCACGAATASLLAYLGEKTEAVQVHTPFGAVLELPIAWIKKKGDFFLAGLQKEAGEDPDVTHGILIWALVECIPSREAETNAPALEFEFLAGEGVGVVCRRGLDQPVGEAAINSVPRRMIRKHLEEILLSRKFSGKVRVQIGAHHGAEIARKTFNERLGVLGGISILGTTGLVVPMSRQALLDSIKTDIRVRLANARERVLFLCPGNMGAEFVREYFQGDFPGVFISNFVGESIDMAIAEGARSILLGGELGKLIKLSGGIMNTHSNDSDSRMELLGAALLALASRQEGAKREELVFQAMKVLQENTTRAALERISPQYRQALGKILGEKMLFYVYQRAWKAAQFYKKGYQEKSQLERDIDIGIFCFSGQTVFCQEGNVEEMVRKLKNG